MEGSLPVCRRPFFKRFVVKRLLLQHVVLQQTMIQVVDEVDSETVAIDYDSFCKSLCPEFYNLSIVNQPVSAQIIQALPHYTYQSNAPPLYKLHCSLVFYA